MAIPTPRYRLRSRNKPRDNLITAEQILNTFYGAFFEPLIRSKTKEFSLDFLNEQNFSSKFPKHWKTLLRNESIKTPVVTFTISIEKLKFVTVKYFASNTIERFLILEPAFLEKLKNDHEKSDQVKSTNHQPSLEEDKIMISIPLNRLSNQNAQKLKIQFIENCEKSFFSKYISTELKKPTLLLGHIFSLPEFKRALVDLDYVTNAIESLKESRFVRKSNDSNDCSSSEESKKEQNSSSIISSSTPIIEDESRTEKLLESFQSLRPTKSREFRRKLAMTKRIQSEIKSFSDTTSESQIESSTVSTTENQEDSSQLDSVSSIVKTVISHNTQPLQLIININQNGGSQSVQIGQRIICGDRKRSVKQIDIENLSKIPSLDILRHEKQQCECYCSPKSILPARTESHVVSVKFTKIKIGIQITLRKYAQYTELKKLVDMKKYAHLTQMENSIRKSFLDYFNAIGRKMFDLKYLAVFSTENFELFKEKKGTIYRCHLEVGKISIAEQKEELTTEIVDSICIKIRNRDTGKCFELFEIITALEDIEESNSDHMSLRQEDRHSNSPVNDCRRLVDDSCDNPEIPRADHGSLLKQIPQNPLEENKTTSKIDTHMRKNEKHTQNERNLSGMFQQCSTSRLDSSGINDYAKNQANSNDLDDESSIDYVDDTEDSRSGKSSIVPVVRYSNMNIQHTPIMQEEATIQAPQIEMQNMEYESRQKIARSSIDEEYSSDANLSYEEFISDTLSSDFLSDFYGFSDDSDENEPNRGIKYGKEIRQEDLPLKKRYILLKSNITNKAREKHYRKSLRLNSFKSLKFSKNLNFLYYIDKNKKILKTRRNSSVNISRSPQMKQRILRRIFSASYDRNSDSFLKLADKTINRDFPRYYKKQHLTEKKKKIVQNQNQFCSSQSNHHPPGGYSSQKQPNLKETFLGSIQSPTILNTISNSTYDIDKTKNIPNPIIKQNISQRTLAETSIAADKNILRQPVLQLSSSFNKEWNSSRSRQNSKVPPDTGITSSKNFQFQNQQQLPASRVREYQTLIDIPCNTRSLKRNSLSTLDELTRQKMFPSTSGRNTKQNSSTMLRNTNKIECTTNTGSKNHNKMTSLPPSSTQSSLQPNRPTQFIERPTNSNYFSEFSGTESTHPMIRQTLPNIQIIPADRSRLLANCQRSQPIRPTSIVAPAVGKPQKFPGNQTNFNQPTYDRVDLSNSIDMSSSQHSGIQHAIPSNNAFQPQYLRKRSAPPPPPPLLPPSSTVPIYSSQYHGNHSSLSNIFPARQRLTAEQNVCGRTFAAPIIQENQIHTRPTQSSHVPNNNLLRISQENQHLRQEENPSLFSQTQLQSIVSSSNLAPTVRTQCCENQHVQQQAYGHYNFQQHQPSYIPLGQTAFRDQSQHVLHHNPYQLIGNNSILQHQLQRPSVQQQQEPNNHNPVHFPPPPNYRNMIIQRYDQILNHLQDLVTDTQRARHILMQGHGGNEQAVVYVLQQAGQDTIIHPINLGVSVEPTLQGNLNHPPRTENFPSLSQSSHNFQQ